MLDCWAVANAAANRPQKIVAAEVRMLATSIVAKQRTRAKALAMKFGRLSPLPVRLSRVLIRGSIPLPDQSPVVESRRLPLPTYRACRKSLACLEAADSLFHKCLSRKLA